MSEKITIRIDKNDLEEFDKTWANDPRFQNRTQVLLWLISLYHDIRDDDEDLGDTLELTGELSR